jgi:hypothetical protein
MNSLDKLEEQLSVAVQALERIRDSDPGPAYYIAKAALEEVVELEEAYAAPQG